MERSTAHRSAEADHPSFADEEIERMRALVRNGWTADLFAPRDALRNGESLWVHGVKWSVVWDAVFGAPSLITESDRQQAREGKRPLTDRGMRQTGGF